MLIDLLESSKAIGLCPMGTMAFLTGTEGISDQHASPSHNTNT